MLIEKCTVVFLLFNAVVGYPWDVGPAVPLNDSLIKGLKADDGNYSYYLGLPYAKVDADNPFGPATPYEIRGVFEAYDDSIICPQVSQGTEQLISFDCLRLNVYVPVSAQYSENLLPVMVFIHGGSFHTGSGSRIDYNPSYFMQHDVIVVTINYRVGSYGFMCLDTPKASGNQGLKDQYLAIKWVKDYIRAFGGDAKQITLFGHSAGAHSVDFHLRSKVKPLFNKAILQSGSAEALTVLYEPDKQAPLKIAKYVGFETNDVEEALLYLTKTEPRLVALAATELNIQFKPCVETLYDSVEPFISKSWIDSRIPNIKNMPILMGFTKLEHAPRSIGDDEFFYNWSIIDDSLLQVFDSDRNFNETKDLVTRYYVGDNKISARVKWGAGRFSSDFTYVYPIHRSLNQYLDNNAGQIFLYMFSYVGGRNSFKTTGYDQYDFMSNLCCASHGDDNAYLFNRPSKPALSEEDRIMTDRLTMMWTNFAKYGHPTPETTDLLPIEWKPYTKVDYNFLDIDSVLVLGKQPLSDRTAFWDLFYTHNRLARKFV